MLCIKTFGRILITATIYLNFAFCKNIQLETMGNKACRKDVGVEANPQDSYQMNPFKLSLQPRVSVQDTQFWKNQKEEQDKQETRYDSMAESQLYSHNIIIPELTKEALETLSKHRFFEEQFENTMKITRRCYKDDVYQGLIDEVPIKISKITQKPQGYGKLIKSDGSLLIGQFKNGLAEGKGVYIFADGSYFQGEFKNNQANCSHGLLQSKEVTYTGSFKKNVIDGRGKEIGPAHTFEGDYVNGKKSFGKLTWKDSDGFVYFYSGSFNENNNFHGKGTLVGTKGTYQGDFVNGVKEGRGCFKGINAIKYCGDYKNGKKQGWGIIYDTDESILYKGYMKDDLPHGRGAAFFDSKAFKTNWIYGINQKMLEDVDQQRQW